MPMQMSALNQLVLAVLWSLCPVLSVSIRCAVREDCANARRLIQLSHLVLVIIFPNLILIKIKNVLCTFLWVK